MVKATLFCPYTVGLLGERREAYVHKSLSELYSGLGSWQGGLQVNCTLEGDT